MIIYKLLNFARSLKTHSPTHHKRIMEKNINKRQKSKVLSGAAMLLGLALLTPQASFADVITVDQTKRGWYDDTGKSNGDGLDSNIFSGWSGSKEYRNWMLFDLNTITGTITSANLVVDIKSYVGDDDSETYELYHVSTAHNLLGTGDIDTFNDLGDGSLYGSQVFTNADDGFEIPIVLTAEAISDMNAAIGGTFAIGGSVPVVGGDEEGLFKQSHLFGARPNLVITTTAEEVPEPSEYALLAVSLTALGVGHRRRKSKANK